MKVAILEMVVRELGGTRFSSRSSGLLTTHTIISNDMAGISVRGSPTNLKQECIMALDVECGDTTADKSTLQQIWW